MDTENKGIFQMIKCEHCGNEFDEEKENCPHCPGEDAFPKEPSKLTAIQFIGRMIFVAFIIALLVAVVLLSDVVIEWVKTLFS